MLAKLGLSFLLGVVVALFVDLRVRTGSIKRLGNRCSAPGCQRESQFATFVIERTGRMRILKAWPLCAWCSSGSELMVHGSPLRFPTIGVLRNEYERVACAVNERFKGLLFDLVTYQSGWMFRRRTFTLGPINTTPQINVVWLSEFEPGSYYVARVNGLPVEVTANTIDTPTGAMVEIEVHRAQAWRPYRASLAFIVGPFTSEPTS